MRPPRRTGRLPTQGGRDIDTRTAPEPQTASSPDRPTTRWLVLSASGRAVLGEVSSDVTTVRRAAPFAGLLRRLEPGLVVVEAPPAGPAELRAALAERRRRPGLRLVFLNEERDVAGRLAALADGFDDALPSTIDPAELSGRARLLADDQRPARTAIGLIRLADGVVLDPPGHRLWRDGTEVHLRPKEFALLALLASAPGRAFSRTELLERVWGPRYHGGDRTVDVHVRWLRAKLEAEPGRPCQVVTVRGTGYRFDPPRPVDGDPVRAR